MPRKIFVTSGGFNREWSLESDKMFFYSRLEFDPPDLFLAQAASQRHTLAYPDYLGGRRAYLLIPLVNQPRGSRVLHNNSITPDMPSETS